MYEQTNLFRRNIKLAHILFLVPFKNILRNRPWNLLSPILSGLFGFLVVGWLVGPVLAADIAPRVPTASRQQWIPLIFAGLLIISVVRGLFWRRCLILSQAWRNLSEIIPQGTQALIICGIVQRVVDPGGLMLLWMMGLGVGFWYGTWIGSVFTMCTAFSLVFGLLGVCRYIVAIAVVRGNIWEVVGTIFGISMVAMGTILSGSGMFSIFWEYLPGNIATALLLHHGAVATNFLVLAFWVIVLYALMVMMLSKTSIEALRNAAFRNCVTWLPCWLRVLCTRFEQIASPKAKYGAFINFLHYGILAAVRSQHIQNNIVPEGVLLAVVAFVLAFQEDMSEFKYLLLFLACSPCLYLSKVLLGDFAKNLWFVRLSQFSVRKALAGYGLGLYIVGLVVGLIFVMAVVSFVKLSGQPLGESVYSQMMFLLWVISFLSPLSVSWGMWARCKFVIVNGGSKENESQPRSYSLMLYVLMVLLPGGIGLSYLQDPTSGIIIFYTLIGGYWGLVLFSHIALSKCDKSIPVH